MCRKKSAKCNSGKNILEETDKRKVRKKMEKRNSGKNILEKTRCRKKLVKYSPGKNISHRENTLSGKNILEKTCNRAQEKNGKIQPLKIDTGKNILELRKKRNTILEKEKTRKHDLEKILEKTSR